MLPLARPGLWISGAVAIGAAIALGSLLPGPVVETVSGYDKFEHAGAYFLLTLWLAGMVERKGYLLAAAVPLLLGAGLEVAQGLLTETRQADPLDLVANAAGITLALVVAYLGLGGWASRVERWLGAVPRS